MDRYIQPGSAILDIGGGPGHYSIHYAGKGHDVTLLDLSDENIRFAKEKAGQYRVSIKAVQGNALDFSRFADQSFDAVFLMGPLYHLANEENRRQALCEAARVLKPGGYLFSSFILMYGGVIFMLRDWRERILQPDQKANFDHAAQGISDYIQASFTFAHLTTIADARRLLDSFVNLRTVTVFGQESILAPYANVLRESPDEIRMAWYEYALKFCDKEEYLSHTEHLMIVSQKI